MNSHVGISDGIENVSESHRKYVFGEKEKNSCSNFVRTPCTSKYYFIDIFHSRLLLCFCFNLVVCFTLDEKDITYSKRKKKKIKQKRKDYEIV